MIMCWEDIWVNGYHCDAQTHLITNLNLQSYSELHVTGQASSGGVAAVWTPPVLSPY